MFLWDDLADPVFDGVGLAGCNKEQGEWDSLPYVSYFFLFLLFLSQLTNLYFDLTYYDISLVIPNVHEATVLIFSLNYIGK